jgi:hypothetical protein
VKQTKRIQITEWIDSAVNWFLFLLKIKDCTTFHAKTPLMTNVFLKYTCLLLFVCLSFLSFSQNVGINAVGTDPDNSAMLDIQSKDKGLLIPRMTLIEKSSIINPANGLLVYQTTDSVGFWYYDANQWVPLFVSLRAGTGLTGGSIRHNGDISIANTPVTPGTYGYRDSIPQFIVNASGQLVFAQNIAIKEKDSIIGNEVTDTLQSHGILNKFGAGTNADPYKLGIMAGNALDDVWFWDGSNWVPRQLPPEIDGIIGNEITDTTNSRGIISMYGSGTKADPFKIGVVAGNTLNDVWTWNGSEWVSKALPAEVDGIIGNEVTDTSQALGMMTKFGSGTAADPTKLGINPGTNINDLWMWNGSKWILGQITIPKEIDAVIGNEITDTSNAHGMLTKAGAGTTASPYTIGMEPGAKINDLWMWDGAKWILGQITQAAEVDGVIGNEVTDTTNALGILTKYGTGTTADPYKLGIQPGGSSNDVWMWNGTDWVPTQISHPAEVDGIIGNEVADTSDAFGVLTRSGSGTAADPFKLGVTMGNSIDDVWMWTGAEWIARQMPHPSEVDGVVGNEVLDTTNARGVLTKFGAGTNASPFKLGITTGTTINDVWMWDGSNWIPKQITHPTEVDGIIGNEVSDTITDGFMKLSGAGTAASPKKVGLRDGVKTGDIIVWDGTKWAIDTIKLNTLDRAYDQDGPGAGRVITADAGAVEINGTDGLLVSGVYSSGALIGTPGAGTRMFFNPRTASLRAGYVNGTQWDQSKVGIYSLGLGKNTVASAEGAISIGTATQATKKFSLAIGEKSQATNVGAYAIGDSAMSLGIHTYAIGDRVVAQGQNSTAIGWGTRSDGPYSMSLGRESLSKGWNSYAMGYQDTAWGKNSIAMGYHSYAEGEGNIAIGYNTRTTNPFSIAIGHNAFGIADKSVALGNNISTNNKNGSFVFGDGSTTTITKSTALNQMMMRFAGGYRLYSNAALTTGVYMTASSGGWTSISDRNAKESFSEIDGEEILASIKRMPVTSWTYKNSDSTIRYMGPMAQDFHNEFGLGGTDSLGINSINMDGVNMAAVKALIDRTDELQDTRDALSQTEAKVAVQEGEIEDLQKEMEELKRMIRKGHRKGFFSRIFQKNNSK